MEGKIIGAHLASKIQHMQEFLGEVHNYIVG